MSVHAVDRWLVLEDNLAELDNQIPTCYGGNSEEITTLHMPRPTSLKLVIVVVAILTVAGIGYAGLLTWRDSLLIHPIDGNHVSEEELTEKTKPPIEPFSPLEPSAAKVDTSGWKTYRNDDFGFEIEYPVTLTLKQGRNTFRFEAIEGAYGTTQLLGAYFSIVIKPTEAQCLTFRPSSSSSFKTYTRYGLGFNAYAWSDCAMGTCYQGINYYSESHADCNRLGWSIHRCNMPTDHSLPSCGNWKKFNQKELEDIFDTMFFTFRFIE